LKDKENPHLRFKVLTGKIDIARFCTMTSVELASKDRQQEIKKIEEMNLVNAQAAKTISAETDQFKCGKCKQRKATYYQLQTRSADEVSKE
jgi:transcription elongation factor S-II